LVLTTSIMQAQTERFKTLNDPKQGSSQILVGQLTAEDIVKNGTCQWFENGMNQYTADSATIEQLKKHINQYSFIVCMGTWCGDTKDLLPKYWKVMQAAGFPTNKIELLGMDRSKQALNIEHLLLRVEKVPTIIINKGPREIGRIVESLSKDNIETELLYIILHDIETWKD
jgi:thiol-disulfide isomerase/thioredoxin